MYSGSLGTHVQEPEGLPSNWADRIGMNYANRVTGSILLNDSDDIKDTSGHSRLSFTDTGDTVLRNAGGTAGISLNSTNNTTLAGDLTLGNKDLTIGSGDIKINTNKFIITGSTGNVVIAGGITGSSDLSIAGSGSFGGVLSSSNASASPVIFTLPTSDPLVKGALFVTGSKPSADLGGITGSARILMVSQGS